MPDQPPEYRTAAEVLDRARALFGLADHELMLALLPAIRDRTSGLGTEDYYRRAEVMANLARAGAELAWAMLLAGYDDNDDAAAFIGEGPSEELLAVLRDRADRDRTSDAG